MEPHISLEELFTRITDSCGVEVRRRESILRDLKHMLGEPATIRADELPNLSERYRAYLQATDAAAATVRNKVCRLGKIWKQAVEQGCVDAESLHQPTGFPIFERPDDANERRRCAAYNAFVDWCVKKDVPYEQRHLEKAVRGYRDELKSSHSDGWAEIRYDDLRRWWSERTDEGKLYRFEFPPFAPLKRTLYGLRRPDWPKEIEREFARFERAASLEWRPGDKHWRDRPLSRATLVHYEKALRQLLGYCLHVKELDTSDIDLRSLLKNEGLVLSYIEWHIRERASGQELQEHQDALRMFAKLIEFLYDERRIARRYRKLLRTMSPSKRVSRLDGLLLDRERIYRSAAEALRDARSEVERAGSLEKLAKGRRMALLLQFRDALIFAVLVSRPFRASNLIGLRVGANLLHDAAGEWRFRFSPREMKGKRPWEGPFPDRLAEDLRYYLEAIRPLFPGDTSNYLFCSRLGKKLQSKGLSARVSRLAEHHFGQRLTTHQFRHLVATAYLLEFPDEFATIQALLGHRYFQTTQRHYIRIQSIEASRKAIRFTKETCPHLQRIGELLRSDNEAPPLENCA